MTTNKSRYWIGALLVLGLAALGMAPARWCVVKRADLALGPYHTRHAEVFGKYVEGFNHGINLAILQGIDIVQAHAMDGGGYFTGKDSVPTESPVYYNLHLFGRPLIEVPRHSSYCSGATYAAFIEALNLLLGERGAELSEERYEALRMQEPDGSRREDHVKFWVTGTPTALAPTMPWSSTPRWAKR